MNEQIKEALRGFNDRMKNIAVYHPIFNLSNKAKYKEYDLVSLGMATLLFMLENMLMNKPTTSENLIHFYQETLSNKETKHLNSEEAMELTGVLVDDYLRNNGKKHEFSFYNFETKTEEHVLFDLIVYDDELSIEEMRNAKLRKIKLSPAGVEMLFKTKELFNELQISISQLYFKQQMVKGLFNEAMQAVKDLALSIQNERTKMRELQSEIIRDAIAVSKRHDLEEHLHRYSEKIEREKVVFEELKSVVTKTLEQYYKGELTEKEQDGLSLILAIQKELLHVVNLHESLFTEKQKLQTSMGNSLESIIVNAFTVKMNFEKDIVSEVVHQQTALDDVHKILNPILPIKTFSIFNPAVAFLEQKKPKKKKEQEEELVELTEEEILAIELEEERKEAEKEEKQLGYLRLLLTPMLTENTVSFSQLLAELAEQESLLYETLISDPLFYSFVIDLHQEQYTAFQKIKKEHYPYVTKMARLLAKLIEENEQFEHLGHFTLLPLEGTVPLPIADVTDFTISRGNQYVVAKKGSN